MPVLRLAEETVSEWSLFALGATSEDWGPWSDRRAFYRAAARIGQGLAWERALELGGGKLHTLAEQARHLYRALQDAPPDAEWDIAPKDVI